MSRVIRVIQYGLISFHLCFATNAIAGTSGLTGQFKGNFHFIANAHTDLNPNTPSTYMGEVFEHIKWEWNFDTGVAHFRFDLGTLYDIDNDYCYPDVMTCDFGFIHGYMLTIGVPITVHSAVNFTDNGDGSYTGLIDFQVYNAVFFNPAGLLEITWDITRTNNSLTITTVDADGNGSPGTILGDGVSTPPWGGFPFPFEPTWSGDARLVGADSNDDGLTDEQAIALGLEPDLMSRDTDGDGIIDVIELGANFSDPLDIDQDGILDAVDPEFDNAIDSDNDGVIDALEPGTDATDSSKANGLRFKGRSKTKDDVNVVLNLSITGQSLAHKPESGDAFQGPPGIHYAFDENTRSIDVGPVLIFQTSSDIGGTVIARLNFSSEIAGVSRLPEKLLLYFVDFSTHKPGLDNGGENYHLQPTSMWTKIDDNTIDIILHDGGAMDEDGLENGSISTSLALANNSKGDFHETSGNASTLSIRFALILLGTLLLLRRTKTC